MQALVLAAGRGTRMRSAAPKVLHEIFGRPILDYVLETLSELGIRNPKVVVGAGADEVRSFLYRRGTARRSLTLIHQREQRGSGHAVMMAEKVFRYPRMHLSGDDILIWPGDMPLLRRETLERFLRAHREAGAAASVLSALRIDPKGYGRILRAGGKFYAIREELDADKGERRIQEVNTGVYLFKAGPLFRALKKIRPANQKKEFYLTDTIGELAGENLAVEAFPFALEDEGQGINSRADLAVATAMMNQREIRYHQGQGVTFVAPEQTFVAPGAKIGQDTVIYPWCYIEAGVRIGRGCRIGPFAEIRKGSRIEDGAVIGCFVEVNRSRIGKKVLAKHLAYLGDAVIGEKTNIGAGTITANFDGKKKHTTRIGKNVLIGSDTILIAPVNVQDGARTGAGSVITRGSRIKKGQVVVGVPARPMKKK